MKSVVTIDIAMAQADLAELIADPRSYPKWMEEVRRIEPLNGKPGAAGSRFRMVARDTGRTFVATVMQRQLPTRFKLSLESPSVSVVVVGQLIKLSSTRTRLLSEETFAFRGALGSALGFLTRLSMRRAHRRQIDALKQLAERRIASADSEGDSGRAAGSPP
jgi:hypothetical protein